MFQNRGKIIIPAVTALGFEIYGFQKKFSLNEKGK